MEQFDNRQGISENRNYICLFFLPEVYLGQCSSKVLNSYWRWWFLPISNLHTIPYVAIYWKRVQGLKDKITGLKYLYLSSSFPPVTVYQTLALSTLCNYMGIQPWYFIQPVVFKYRSLIKVSKNNITLNPLNHTEYEPSTKLLLSLCKQEQE